MTIVVALMSFNLQRHNCRSTGVMFLFLVSGFAQVHSNYSRCLFVDP